MKNALPTNIIEVYLPTRSEFVTNAYVEQLLSTHQWSEHGATLDLFMEEVLSDDPRLSGKDLSDPVNDPAIKAALHDWLLLRYNYVVEDLNLDMPDWPVKAKRALYLSNEAIEQLQDGSLTDIGRHWGLGAVQAWSVDPECIDPSLKEVVVTASIWPDDIDWTETLRSRFDYENGDQEQEIFLAKSAEPTFESIEVLAPVQEQTNRSAQFELAH